KRSPPSYSSSSLPYAVPEQGLALGCPCRPAASSRPPPRGTPLPPRPSLLGPPPLAPAPRPLTGVAFRLRPFAAPLSPLLCRLASALRAPFGSPLLPRANSGSPRLRPPRWPSRRFAFRRPPRAPLAHVPAPVLPPRPLDGLSLPPSLAIGLPASGPPPGPSCLADAGLGPSPRLARYAPAPPAACPSLRPGPHSPSATRLPPDSKERLSYSHNLSN
ncbi:vegetative cell wall protein gp1-like, partial [Peromyscus leucopus]|uniref:vegetative cell wall protein gp1-like n=1 Tax=Peromyscus leucopus TaxID=10041 RepID=UPI001884D8B4